MSHEIVASELERIAKEHGGRLDARDVVEAARSRTSPLHSYFTWDNKEAAELRRVDEARALIRTLHVRFVTENYDGKIRSWYPARSVFGANETGYIAETEIRDDPEMRAGLLRSMEREWLAMKRRYGHLAEFWLLVKDEDEQTKTA